MRRAESMLGYTEYGSDPDPCDDCDVDDEDEVPECDFEQAGKRFVRTSTADPKSSADTILSRRLLILIYFCITGLTSVGQTQGYGQNSLHGLVAPSARNNPNIGTQEFWNDFAKRVFQPSVVFWKSLMSPPYLRSLPESFTSAHLFQTLRSYR